LICAQIAALEIQDVNVDDGTGAGPWLLTADDHALVREKSRTNRLAFAVLLLFHRSHGRFPKRPTEIDAATVEHVAQQLSIEANLDLRHPATDRTWKRHRAEIRTRLGYREPTVADAEALEAWLCGQVATAGTDPDHLATLLAGRCRELRIEPPTPNRIGRVVRAAVRAHDERFCVGIKERLAPGTRAKLDALLKPADDEPKDRPPGTAPALLLQLRGSPGRPSLAGIQDELAKVDLIRAIDCVLVWKFDRFARSTRHLLSALEEFDHLGVRFVSVQDQVDTDSPMGRAMFTIIAAMAELESALISERVTAGMTAAAARGKHLGRPPLPRHVVAEIKALATSTDLSVRKIHEKMAGKASRGIVGEITKQVRSP
jgi:hypothetical protein